MDTYIQRNKTRLIPATPGERAVFRCNANLPVNDFNVLSDPAAVYKLMSMILQSEFHA